MLGLDLLGVFRISNWSRTLTDRLPMRKVEHAIVRHPSHMNTASAVLAALGSMFQLHAHHTQSLFLEGGARLFL